MFGWKLSNDWISAGCLNHLKYHKSAYFQRQTEHLFTLEHFSTINYRIKPIEQRIGTPLALIFVWRNVVFALLLASLFIRGFLLIFAFLLLQKELFLLHFLESFFLDCFQLLLEFLLARVDLLGFIFKGIVKERVTDGLGRKKLEFVFKFFFGKKMQVSKINVAASQDRLSQNYLIILKTRLRFQSVGIFDHFWFRLMNLYPQPLSNGLLTELKRDKELALTEISF